MYAWIKNGKKLEFQSERTGFKLVVCPDPMLSGDNCVELWLNIQSSYGTEENVLLERVRLNDGNDMMWLEESDTAVAAHFPTVLEALEKALDVLKTTILKKK
jgi:hypothetical protein